MPRTLLATTASAALLLALPAAAPAAEVIYGVTEDNRLVTLNSSAPGNVERSVPIAGLAAGESIVGLDVRPATDQLSAAGSTSRVYRLVPGSGFLRPVGAGPFVPALTGTSFGVDFNPTVETGSASRRTPSRTCG